MQQWIVVYTMINNDVFFSQNSLLYIILIWDSDKFLYQQTFKHL